MIKLYNYFRSSSSWRVRIALGWKGIPYEYQVVSLIKDEHRAPGYHEKNPMEQVPLLEISEGGRTRRIGQSVAIIEWLEETHPTPALLPRDAFLRARARQLAEIVNSGTQPFQNLEVLREVKAMGADEQAFARDHVGRGLRGIEALAAETSGTYLIGDEVSIADVFLVPQLYGARRFGVDLGALPRLVKIEAALAALPAFAAAQPDRQPDAPAP
jgi:maleylpyruvate isomerase